MSHTILIIYMPKHELIKHIVDKVDSIAMRSQPYAKKQGMMREKK